MARTSTRLIARFAVACVLAGLGLLTVGAAPAFAHASVASSDPADGANLTAAPAQVSITFDESVRLQSGYLRVIDGSGRRVDSGPAFHPGGRADTVAVALRSGLPRAAYLVSYRVVSADSHPVGGVLRFGVGGASLDAVADVHAQTTDPGVTLLLDVARALSFLGLAAAGGWWLVLLLGHLRREAADDDRGHPAWPRGTRRIVAGGLGAALLGALAELFGQGPYAAGTGLGGLGRTDLVADTLMSSFGRWHLAQLVLLAVLLAAVVSGFREDALRHPVAGAVVGGGLWLAVLVCVAATGHAAARAPVWLGELSTVLHLVAITVWIGGLVLLAGPLLATPAPAPDDGRRAGAAVLPVFSRVALLCVVTIAATGAYQAWREVGSWGAFVDTRYGVLVLVKIGLFAALVALGALARRALRRGTATGETAAVARLRKGVLVEVALAACVLIVTAVLVAQPPGRAPASADGTAPATVTVALSGTRTLRVEVAPGRSGPVVVTVTAGPGPAVQKITVTALLPSRSIGPIPIPVTAVDDLDAKSEPVTLPAPGTWQFTVTVQTSEFDVVSATAVITLR